MDLFFLGNEVIISPSAVVIFKLLWIACLFLCKFSCASLTRTLSQNNAFSAFSLQMGTMHWSADTFFFSYPSAASVLMIPSLSSVFKVLPCAVPCGNND